MFQNQLSPWLRRSASMLVLPSFCALLALAALGGNDATYASASLNVTPNPAPAGTTTITIAGSGFGGNQMLGVGPRGVIPTVEVWTNSSGAFALAYTPWDGGFNIPGNYPVDAKDSRGRLVATTTLVVVASNAPSDADADGFGDSLEKYLGTNLNDACSNTATVNDEAVDAWPVDFNDDRSSDSSDLSKHTSYFNKPVPLAPARFDLNQDGMVDITDVSITTEHFGRIC